MTHAVEVSDLHKTYRPQVFAKPVHALRGVSFAVREGECFGYLGQNGAGKTTTMKVLTGLTPPTRSPHARPACSPACGSRPRRRAASEASARACGSDSDSPLRSSTGPRC